MGGILAQAVFQAAFFCKTCYGKFACVSEPLIFVLHFQNLCSSMPLI